MEEVPAAAQYHRRPRRAARGQLAGHHVEVDAAARRDDELAAVGHGGHGAGQVRQPAAERRHRAGGLLPGVAADAALVAGHARHRQGAGRGRRLGHSERLVIGPAAGPPQPDLHQDREPASGRAGGEDAVQDGHAVGAVHVAVRREAGIGGELARQPRDACLVDKLVGYQQAGEAEGPVGPQLADGGHGDAPGAAGQLAGGQLGRHGGLAVRRQLHPGPGAVGGHRRQVARQRRLAQGEHRVAEPGRVHGRPGPGQARGAGPSIPDASRPTPLSVGSAGRSRSARRHSATSGGSGCVTWPPHRV